MLDTLISGAAQGLLWAVLALGVFVSYRMLDFADLTCEGAMTLGASVGAVAVFSGLNPFFSLLLAFLSGAVAGCVTGLLHTKLKIPPILSGILTMIALYSINIHVMSLATGQSGTANLSLLTCRENTLFAKLSAILPIGRQNVSLLFALLFSVAVAAVLYWFFGTEIGCTIRATGNNEKMCRAQGINTNLTKILGLALGNGLIALCGSLLCQYQQFSDVNMGSGAIVIGLASIIIGEAIFARATNFFFRLFGVVVGSVVYRVVVSVIIFSGVPATDLKLMTAVLVVVALTIGGFDPRKKKKAALKATKEDA